VLESSLDTFADYQGGSFAASRSWAAANEEALLGYIIGYLEGLAWTLDPANRNEAAELLLAKMPAINPKAINKVMSKLLDPRSGLTPLGKINTKGFQTALELRSHYIEQKAPLTDTDKYIDLTYYEKALKAL
jgi:ABC-type nitrate/sulfonate/bicarbonate transport system substrate-binding protein